MNKPLAVLASIVTLIGLVGCGPSYVGQPTVAVPVQQSQSVISGTCINANQQVMDDYYCDPNWIAQQRAIAMQQNNQALLNSLLLYHMIYTPTPYYVGSYIPRTGVVIYNSPPANYVVQRRSTYVTNINNHSINYQPGRGATTVTQRSSITPQSQTSSWGSRFGRTNSTGTGNSNITTTQTTSITKPTVTQSTSRPTTSFGRSSSTSIPSSPTFGTRSSSSTSFSRPSSSYSSSSSSSSFGSRRR